MGFYLHRADLSFQGIRDAPTSIIPGNKRPTARRKPRVVHSGPSMARHYATDIYTLRLAAE